MRYKMIISYDGTNYHGYQAQEHHPSIQGSIEKALRLMTQLDIKTYAASRTDKGVHALYQVLHFDTDIDLESDQWVDALHKRLPGDIRVKKVVKVKDTFHARFSAKSKLYIYKISKKPLSAFESNHAIYVKHFNLDLVKDRLSDLVGEHDFSAFSPNKENKPPIKTIYSFTVTETKNFYIFKIHGNHFLRYMVRSIMGNFIYMALGKKDQDQLKRMLETKNRLLTAKTAPAEGLYLAHIYY